LYVRFQAGSVDVKDEAIIALLREHPRYNVDFLEIKDSDADPFVEQREEIEPTHTLAEVKYGHVEKAQVSARASKMSPELKRVVEAEAMKMLPKLLKSNPKVLKEIILAMAAEMKTKEDAAETTKEAEEEVGTDV
jgi:hypothetical protein